MAKKTTYNFRHKDCNGKEHHYKFVTNNEFVTISEEGKTQKIKIMIGILPNFVMSFLADRVAPLRPRQEDSDD